MATIRLDNTDNDGEGRHMHQDQYSALSEGQAGAELKLTSRGAYASKKVRDADPPAWQTEDGRWRAQRTYSGPPKPRNEDSDYELLLMEGGRSQHKGYFRVSDEALHHAAVLDGHDVTYEYK